MAVKAVGRVAEVSVISSSTPVDAVAALLSEALRGSAHKRFGIAGGSALKAVQAVHTMLGPVQWGQVSLTWVDERIVDEASDDSNRGALTRAGAMNPRLELPLVLDGETGEQAVKRVTAAFTRDFQGGLDVALLGMGEDGHVASLFPGHRLLDETSASFAWLDDSPKPPKGRVTMTRTILAKPTLKRFVLATGDSKRVALQHLLDGDSSLPMAMLGPITVVTDQHFSNAKGGG